MRTILLVIMLTMLISCSNPDEHNTFTFSTGVKLEEVRELDNKSYIEGNISVKKSDNDYLVTVVDYFSCGKLQNPELRERGTKKLTLVISPEKLDTGFNSSCDCGRSITIRLSNRAHSGDTLYVLNEYSVLGHVVLQ